MNNEMRLNAGQFHLD